jgi:hypothetical protein
MSDSVAEHETADPGDPQKWRAIYLGVIIIFTLWVLLLTALSRAFQ